MAQHGDYRTHDLDPFDTTTICPKCHFGHVASETLVIWPTSTVRVLRRCAQCSWEWYQYALDYDPEAERALYAARLAAMREVVSDTGEASELEPHGRRILWRNR